MTFPCGEASENETPVELAIRVKYLVEKWLKDCPNWQDVVDVVSGKVKVWVKE